MELNVRFQEMCPAQCLRFVATQLSFEFSYLQIYPIVKFISSVKTYGTSVIVSSTALATEDEKLHTTPDLG